MNIKNEADVARLVESDPWMMEILRAAEELNLPNWWIGAGFLRNRIWDAMSGNLMQKPRDIDLVYFNQDDTTAETDWLYDRTMKERHPSVEWEVRNQARMHYKNDDKPYVSTEDGIAHWVETATCIAVRLVEGDLEFLWCYGMDDVLSMTARPIPMYQKPEYIEVFRKRVAEKSWQSRWPCLKVVES